MAARRVRDGVRGTEGPPPTREPGVRSSRSSLNRTVDRPFLLSGVVFSSEKRSRIKKRESGWRKKRGKKKKIKEEEKKKRKEGKKERRGGKKSISLLKSADFAPAEHCCCWLASPGPGVSAGDGAVAVCKMGRNPLPRGHRCRSFLKTLLKPLFIIIIISLEAQEKKKKKWSFHPQSRGVCGCIKHSCNILEDETERHG